MPILCPQPRQLHRHRHLSGPGSGRLSSYSALSLSSATQKVSVDYWELWAEADMQPMFEDVRQPHSPSGSAYKVCTLFIVRLRSYTKFCFTRAYTKFGWSIFLRQPIQNLIPNLLKLLQFFNFAWFEFKSTSWKGVTVICSKTQFWLRNVNSKIKKFIKL